MNYITTTLYRLLMLFILIAATIVFLLTTTPGLYTSFKLANLLLPGTIKITQAKGSLSQQFSFETLTYTKDTLQLDLKQGSIIWQLPTPRHRQLTLTKIAIDHVAINHLDKYPTTHKPLATHTLSAPPTPPKTLKPPIPIQINEITVQHLDIQTHGQTQQYQQISLQGSINQKQWTIKKLSLQGFNQQMNLTGQGDLTAPYPLLATLTTSPLKHHTGLDGHVTIHGDWGILYWTGDFNGFANGHLSGTLKNGFEIIAQLNWNHITWPVHASTEFKSSQGKIELHGTWLDLIMSSHANVEAPIVADWQLSARVKDHQTNAKAVLHLPKGPLQTTLIAKATVSNAQQGQLSVTIEPGIYQGPPNRSLPSLPFKGGHVLATLTPQALTMQGLFTLDANKTIDMSLRLPKFSLDHAIDAQSTMTGSLQAHIQSLDFLQALSKNIEHPQGQLTMRLLANGSIAKPIIKGEMFLKNASVSIPSTGLTLNPINIHLTSHNNLWQTKGTITSEGQILTLTGEGRLAPNLMGQLKLEADNFPLMKTAQYNIHLSPKLTLYVTQQALDIRGEVLIPSATLKLLTFSDGINLSDDVVFVHSPTAPSPFNITSQVQLKMGEKVNLDVKGLHGRLDGAIRIDKQPNSTMTATGELHILDGKYRAYGQDLTLEQGQLLFTGGPIDNPGINLRAIRKFKNTGSSFSGSSQPFAFNTSNIDSIGLSNNTTVGIDITGRLHSTKIKLFSIPSSLSQSDILSMLILGKPASQANKAGGQLLLAAVSSMNLDSGTKGMQLMDQLQHTLGIDFDIQNNTTYNQKTNQATDNTSLRVGKSLTKRIYVSYNVSLLQTDSNVLTLTYLLNKFFSIQVNATDTASGIDLLYNHSKD